MRYRRTHRGFTLIEIIVAVAIVAVLVTIAGGAVFRRMSSGEVVKCRTNLEELVKLGIKYSEDLGHQNLLPTSGMDDDEDTPEMDESEGWWLALAQELDSTVLPNKKKKMKLSVIFHCPSDKRRDVPRSGIMEADENTVSYVSWTDASEPQNQNPNSQIRIEGNKRLDNLPWLSDGVPQKGKSVNDYDSFRSMVVPALKRHNNTLLVAYASGQVRAFETAEMDTKELFKKINPDKLIPLRRKRK